MWVARFSKPGGTHHFPVYLNDALAGYYVAVSIPHDELDASHDVGVNLRFITQTCGYVPGFGKPGYRILS